MKTWVRRLRGAVGIGLAWGAAWLVAGLALLAVVGLHAADVPFPLFFGFLGFLCGATFSVILGALGARRRFADMSVGRFALWGALGGLIVVGAMIPVAGITGAALVLGPIFAGAGAICATGTLVVARKAEASVPPPHELPP